MRHAVAMILGLLLVLRGLMGDAMAMGVVPAAPAQQTAVASALPYHHDTAGAADAHGGHGDHAASALQHCCDGSSIAHAEHQAGCTACGICHSAFSATTWAPAVHAPLGGALQPHDGTRFASAWAAQAIKPPIS